MEERIEMSPGDERWRRLAGRVELPVTVSVVVGIAVWLAARYWFVPEPGTVERSLWMRIAVNGYCQAMIGLFAAGAIYGVLQVWGLFIEERKGVGAGFAGVVTGRLGDLHGHLTDLRPEDRDIILLARRRREQQPLQFVIWVLPMLGFIGTVLGITDAIGGLGSIVGGGGADDQSVGLVLGGLRFAFDTTLIGLTGTIPLMLLLYWLRARAAHADAVRILAGRSGIRDP